MFYGRSFRTKVQQAMSKDAAMSVLGLSMTTEGEKQKRGLELWFYHNLLREGLKKD